MQNQIHSKIHPVYDKKYFTKPAVNVWCKKCQVGRNLHQILNYNQSFVSGLDINQHFSLDRAFRSLLRDRTNV